MKKEPAPEGEAPEKTAEAEWRPGRKAGRRKSYFSRSSGVHGTLLAGGKQHGLFHDVIRIGVKAVGVAVGACRSGFGYDGAAGFADLEIRGAVDDQFGFIQAGSAALGVIIKTSRSDKQSGLP